VFGGRSYCREDSRAIQLIKGRRNVGRRYSEVNDNLKSKRYTKYLNGHQGNW